ncbi:hypothetical protein BHUM_01903c [Candidatus Burkholderia humilis]|nr:hypothetical protein BHUM_01903c [Candidatus Burkholderia humilis]
MIHDEWTRNVLENRKDLKPEAVARTRQLMDANVREALIENFEHLIASIELPDANDRHVVAATMHAGAELKSLKSPPKTVDDYLDTLATQGLTQTVNTLRPLA